MEKMTFEQAIKRLEEIVDLLENNETSLEDFDVEVENNE